MDRSMVTVSKFLAKHLRHAPDALGLTLQPGGWVSVDELLAPLNSGLPLSCQGKRMPPRRTRSLLARR
jgi:putative RNA 2'-phosphotransferase